jgi:hypothetical protein
MRWTRKTIAIAVTGAAFLLGGSAAAAGALTSNSSPSVILAAPAALGGLEAGIMAPPAAVTTRWIIQGPSVLA